MKSRSLKPHLLVNDFDHEAIRRNIYLYQAFSISFFVKRFFQNLDGFIATLNQYLAFILTIIIVIIEHLFIVCSLSPC